MSKFAMQGSCKVAIKKLQKSINKITYSTFKKSGQKVLQVQRLRAQIFVKTPQALTIPSTALPAAYIWRSAQEPQQVERYKKKYKDG